MTDRPSKAWSEAEDLPAELRRALLERDQARWTVALLKAQLKSMRQHLRREQADHRATAMKLEAAEIKLGGSFPPTR